MKYLPSTLAVAVIFNMAIAVPAAQAEIDGHGPDAWRVTDVSPSDVLNARMGPGTSYPVIETFAHNERGMQQITCVPFYTPAHYSAMTQAQINALPPRWCLMRNKEMSKAGWVAQRYITPDDQVSSAVTTTVSRSRPRQPETRHTDVSGSGDDLIAAARDLVRELYERQFQSDNNGQPSGLDPDLADNYFTSDIVAWLTSGQVAAHPLYGAQDFDGTVEEPMPDPDQPMLRGMITINVDFTNFGQNQRAIFYLRADTTRNNSPLRIFRVEHDGWSYP